MTRALGITNLFGKHVERGCIPASHPLRTRVFRKAICLVSFRKLFLLRTFKQVLNVLGTFAAAERKHLHRDPTKFLHTMFLMVRARARAASLWNFPTNEVGLVSGVASNLFGTTYCQVCKLHNCGEPGTFDVPKIIFHKLCHWALDKAARCLNKPTHHDNRSHFTLFPSAAKIKF